MPPPRYESWRWEPRSARRNRNMREYQSIVEQITPLVRSAEPGALQRAKQIVDGDRTREKAAEDIRKKARARLLERARKNGLPFAVPDEKGGLDLSPGSLGGSLKKAGGAAFKALGAGQQGVQSLVGNVLEGEVTPRKALALGVQAGDPVQALKTLGTNLIQTLRPGGYEEGLQKYEEATAPLPTGAQVALDVGLDPLTWIGPGAVRGALRIPQTARGGRAVSLLENLFEQPAKVGIGGAIGAGAGAQLSEELGFGTAGTLAATIGGGFAGALAPGALSAARNATRQGISQRAQELLTDLTPVMAAARGEGPSLSRSTRANARRLARMGATYRFWYETGSKAIKLASQGDVDAGTEQAILFSFGSPNTQTLAQATGFIRANAQRASGQPIEDLHRFSQFDRAADNMINLYRHDRQAFIDEVVENVSSPEAVNPKAKAPKLGPFFVDLLDDVNPEMAEEIRRRSGSGAVVDLWQSQMYGFGKQPTPRQRQLIQQDVARIAKETGWLPKQVQAAQWVAYMAEARKKPIGQLGADYLQALQRHVAQLQWETMPGESTDLYRMLDGLEYQPYEVQAELHRRLGTLHLDDDGYDPIARRLGGVRLGQFDGAGIERISGTQVNLHPGTAERYAAGPVNSKTFLVDPAARQQLDDIALATAHWRGQRAIAWHRFFPKAPAWMRNGVDFDLGADIDPRSALAIGEQLDDSFVVVPIPNGVRVFAIPDDDDLDIMARTVKGVSPQQQAAFAAINKARQDTITDAVRVALPGVSFKKTAGATDGSYITTDSIEDLLRRDELARPSKPGAPTLREITDELASRTRIVIDQFAAEHGLGRYGGLGEFPGEARAPQGGVPGQVPQLGPEGEGWDTFAASLDAAPEGVGAALRKAFGGTPLRTLTQTGGGAAYGALFPDEGESRAESALLAGSTALGAGLGIRAATARSVGQAAQAAAEDIPTADVAMRRGSLQNPEGTPRVVKRANRIQRESVPNWEEQGPDHWVGVDNTGRPLANNPEIFVTPERGWGFSYGDVRQDGFSSRGDAIRAVNLRGKTPLPDVNGRIWWHGALGEHEGVDPEYGIFGTSQGPGAYLSSFPERSFESYAGETGTLYAVELDTDNVIDLTQYVRPDDPVLPNGATWGSIHRQIGDELERIGVDQDWLENGWEKLFDPDSPYWPRGHQDSRNLYLHARVSGRELLDDGRVYASGYQYRDAMGIALRRMPEPARGSGLPHHGEVLNRLDRGIFGGAPGAPARDDEGAIIKAYLAEKMRQSGADVLFHHSPLQDGEVVIVLNGEVGAHPIVATGLDPKDIPDGSTAEGMADAMQAKGREAAGKPALQREASLGLMGKEMAKPPSWREIRPGTNLYNHWVAEGRAMELDGGVNAGRIWVQGKINSDWFLDEALPPGTPMEEAKALVHSRALEAEARYLRDYQKSPLPEPQERVSFDWRERAVKFVAGEDIPRLGMVDDARAKRLSAKGLDMDEVKAALTEAPDSPIASAAEAAVEAAERPTFIRMQPHEMAMALGLDDAMVRQLRGLDARARAKTLSPQEALQRKEMGRRLTEEYRAANAGRMPVWVLPADARPGMYAGDEARLQKARAAGMSEEQIAAADLNPRSHTLEDYIGRKNAERMYQLERIASSGQSKPEYREAARRKQFEERGVPIPVDRPLVTPPEALQAAAEPKPKAKPSLRERVAQRALESLSEDSPLAQVFGSRTAAAAGPQTVGGGPGNLTLSQQVPAGPSKAEQWRNRAWDALNFPRTLVAQGDVSFMLRQAIFLAPLNPKAYGRSVAAGYEALKSEKNADAIMDSIFNSPRGKLKQKYLEFTEHKAGKSGTSLTKREENFMSNYAANVPVVKQTGRANVVFLNNLRSEIFDMVVDEWDAAGKVYGAPELEKLGNAIMVMSGRGNIRGLTDAGPLINAAFFSPRFFASRLQMPLLLLDPTTRAMAARSLGSMVVVGTAISTLAALAGADVGFDPRSGNWGKVKAGPVSYDFWAGYAPLTRTIARLISGETIDPATGEAVGASRLSELGKFVEGKLSPTAGTGLDLVRGDSRWGEDLALTPESVGDQVWNHTMPLFLQDAFSAAVGREGPGSLAKYGPSTTPTEGAIGAAGVVPSFFGLGAQTYHGAIDDLDNAAQALSANDSKYQGSVGFWDLEASDRDRIKKESPDIWERYVSAGSGKLQRAEEVRGSLGDAQKASDQDLLANKITLQQWQEQLEERTIEQRARLAEVYGERATTKPKNALDRWANAINEAKDPRTGAIDWDAVREWEGLQSPEDRAYIERNSGLGGTPLTRHYGDLRADYYSLSKYRGYSADQAQQIDFLYQEALNQRRREGDRLSMLNFIRRQDGLYPEEVIKGARRKVFGMLRESQDREKWRRQHPEAEFIFRRGNLTASDVEAISELVTAVA